MLSKRPVHCDASANVSNFGGGGKNEPRGEDLPTDDTEVFKLGEKVYFSFMKGDGVKFLQVPFDIYFVGGNLEWAWKMERNRGVVLEEQPSRRNNSS